MADSWDVDDEPATTPEDDLGDDLDDAEAGSIPKVSKKKLPKVEEWKSKKEHVNVVFIGHVGKILQFVSLPNYSTFKKKALRFF